VHIAVLAAGLLLAGAVSGCASTSGTEREPERGKEEQYVQAAGHVARSHTTGIIMRPVSSLFRLLVVTANTVTTSVKPAYSSRIESRPIPELNDGPGMDLVEWESHLDRKTRKASRGTIDLLIDGEEFFARFTKVVNEAERSLSLRMYIFDNDDFAVQIGELIKQRSNEGIEARVLLDGIGTIVSTIIEHDTLPENHEPPVSVRQFLEEDAEVVVRQAHNPWFTSDHVKMAIVDNRVAFAGGMNIGREYRYDWHDLMMELRGPVVDVLRHEFDKVWAYEGFFGDLAYVSESMRPRTLQAEDLGYPVRTLFTRPAKPEIYRVQREAIRRARSYIYVQNPYFTDDVMLYELAKARKRGVDVRVIVPVETDFTEITRNNVLAANALLRNGVRVYLYPGMSHVKAALFDDWACLGSANWDRLSFHINKELNIATSEPSVVKQLKERLFQHDFAKSVELKEPIPERWSDYLYELLGDYFF